MTEGSEEDDIGMAIEHPASAPAVADRSEKQCAARHLSNDASGVMSDTQELQSATFEAPDQ